MPGLQLTSDTRGARRAFETLDGVSRRGADARPAWPDILDMLQRDAAERLTSEGASAGWERVAQSTLERDARGNRDPKLMRVTGALERALTAKQARGGIRRRGKLQLRYGTSLFYADFHQRGRGVPERKLVEMEADQQRRAAATLERYMAFGGYVRNLASFGGTSMRDG